MIKLMTRKITVWYLPRFNEIAIRDQSYITFINFRVVTNHEKTLKRIGWIRLGEL